MSRKLPPPTGFGSNQVATPTQPTKVAPQRTVDRVAAAARNLPPATPGVRTPGASASENSVTSRIERISAEITPAPLPPSPAADAADVWFEQVPTNPAAIPDLDALGLNRSDPRGSAIRSSTPAGRASANVLASEAAGETWSDTSGLPRRSGASTPWLLPALIAATCLAVGMVLGALLFHGSAPAATAQDAGACVCPEHQQ